MNSESPCASLVYVSRSSLARPRDDVEILHIVGVSRRRNQALDVTGALIATHHFFAQILEGPSKAIDELMQSIGRDSRHRDVTIVRQETLPRPRFAGWSMAYSGSAGYVDRDIAPLFGPRPSFDAAPDTDRLLRLFMAFVR